MFPLRSCLSTGEVSVPETHPGSVCQPCDAHSHAENLREVLPLMQTGITRVILGLAEPKELFTFPKRGKLYQVGKAETGAEVWERDSLPASAGTSILCCLEHGLHRIFGVFGQKLLLRCKADRLTWARSQGGRRANSRPKSVPAGLPYITGCSSSSSTNDYSSNRNN